MAKKKKKSKGPFDDALNQLSDILGVVDDKKVDFQEGNLPSGLKDHVNNLRDFVGKFKESTDELLSKSGVDPQELTSQKSVDQISKKDQRAFKQLEEMKKELEARKEMIQQAIRQAEEGNKPELVKEVKEESDQKKLARKKRKLKKKFRGMDGDGWVKM